MIDTITSWFGGSSTTSLPVPDFQAFYQATTEREADFDTVRAWGERVVARIQSLERLASQYRAQGDIESAYNAEEAVRIYKQMFQYAKEMSADAASIREIADDLDAQLGPGTPEAIEIHAKATDGFRRVVAALKEIDALAAYAEKGSYELAMAKVSSERALNEFYKPPAWRTPAIIAGVALCGFAAWLLIGRIPVGRALSDALDARKSRSMRGLGAPYRVQSIDGDPPSRYFLEV